MSDRKSSSTGARPDRGRARILRACAWLALALVPLRAAGQPPAAEPVVPPAEPKLVLAGSAALRPGWLVGGSDTTTSWVVRGDERRQASTTIRSFERVRRDGEDLIIMRQAHANPAGDTTFSVTTVRARDFAMVHQTVRGARDSASAASSHGTVSAWVALPGQPVQLFDVDFMRPVLPVEGQLPWIASTLPFADGYRAEVRYFSPWQGGEVPVVYETLGADTLRIDGRSRPCWKVDCGPLGPPGFRATRWFDRATGRVVQSALQGPPGREEYWSYTRPGR